MSDIFGATTIPIAVPAVGEAVSDPCLDVLLAYLKATLNAYADDAWQAVAPGNALVHTTIADNPDECGIVEKDLPALYGWRSQQAQPPGYIAEDWLVVEDAITLQWIAPTVALARHSSRGPMSGGLIKAALVAMSRERDPAYVHADDTDPKAPTVAADPDAIKLSFATSTSAATYSGAALDGATGAGNVSPYRPVTITLGGDASAFAAGSHVVVTGTNVVGVAQSETLTIAGLGTLTTSTDYAAVTSIAVDAQSSAAGTITVGLGARAGLGSVVRRMAGVFQWSIARWSTRILRNVMADGSKARAFEVVELQVTVREKLDVDTTDTTRFSPNTATDVALLGDDDSVIESARWPDAAE